MQKIIKPRASRSLLLWAFILTALSIEAPLAIAQTAAATQDELASGEPKQLQISAQPLGEALFELSNQFGVTVLVDEKLVQGKSTAAVAERLTLEDALKKLLAGSGLDYRFSDSKTVMLVKRSGGDGPLTLAPIKVKGELIERDLQESQTSIALITGNAIESRGSDDLGDFLQREAGVSVAGGIVTIRGINSAGAAGLGSGGLITTTIDGVRVSRVANQLSTENSTWDLEQIEVLRGPQSTQNGLNSLAGSIVINSQDPVHALEGKVRLGAGNGDKREAALAINTPVVEDVLAIRFSAEAVRTDGFIDNPTLGVDDVDFLDREVYRLGLLFEPSDRWISVLKVSFNDSEYGSDAVDSDEFPSSREKDQLTEDIRTKEVFAANLENTFFLTDTFSLETSTSYSEFEIFTQFEGLFGGLLPTNGAREFDQELFDQEVRVRFEGDSGVQAVVGAFYSETDIKSRTLAFLAAPFTAPFDLPLGGIVIPAGFTAPAGFVLADLTSTNDQKNYAFFGEVEFPITDNLRGVIGARYDDSEFGDEQSDAFVPKVGIVYDIDSRKSIGLTYQEGFREGGERSFEVTDSSSGSAVNRLITVPFDPQFAKNYEVSFRSEWLDGGLIFNANVFATQWEDMQVRELVQVTDPDVVPQFGASVTTNAAESSLWGGELDLRARVNDNLEVFSNIAYVDTEFDDFVSFEGGAPLDLSGNQFRSSPEKSLYLGANYQFGNGWQFSADASFTDATFSEAENLEALENDSYWVVNARVSKRFNNGLVVTAYVDNLFDEDYTTNRNPVTDFVGVARDNAGPPVTYGVFAQYEF